MIFVTLWAQFTAPTISRGPNFRTNIFRGPTCRKKSQWARFANVEEEDDDVEDEDKGQSVEQKVWLIDDECPSHLHLLISISKWNYVIKLHRRCFFGVGTVSPQIQQIGCNLKKSNLHIKSKGSSAPQIPFCLFVCDMGRVVFRAIERQCLDFNIFVNVNMFLVRLAENDENSGVVLSFL